MKGMETKWARGKCIANALVCQLCWTFLLAHSKNELMQWRGVRHMSVRPSVNFCANRFFSQTNDRYQTFTRWTPGQRPSRVCSRSRSRSKVTWYGHFCAGRKIASSRRPSLHKGYVRQQCVYIRRPLANKFKLSRKPHSRTKHHVSVLYTAGVMLLYVWPCEECRLSLLTYLLTYFKFLRQICFSTFVATIMSENIRFHANTEIVIKIICLSLIVIPILTFL